MSRAEDYLRERAGVLKVPIWAGPIRLPLQRAIASGMIVCRDVTDTVRAHDAIELDVHPIDGLPFPDMHILLTARPQFPPGTSLSIELTYEAPLRSIGRVLDAVAGRYVAMSIARTLLEDLCSALARPSENPHNSAAAAH
jgi:hypothetical protein